MGFPVKQVAWANVVLLVALIAAGVALVALGDTGTGDGLIGTVVGVVLGSLTTSLTVANVAGNRRKNGNGGDTTTPPEPPTEKDAA